MLEVEALRALVTTSVADADLEEIIAREESWLAHQIGQLEGSRVEHFRPTGSAMLRLSRRTADATVTDSGTAVTTMALRPWSDVVLTDYAAWSYLAEVEVEYTPDDELDVQRALITLVGLTLAASPWAGQTSGPYSATVNPAEQRRMRYVAWRGLLRPDMGLSIPPGNPSVVGPVLVAPTAS
jgi:hypothetical protein